MAAVTSVIAKDAATRNANRVIRLLEPGMKTTW